MKNKPGLLVLVLVGLFSCSSSLGAISFGHGPRALAGGAGAISSLALYALIQKKISSLRAAKQPDFARIRRFKILSGFVAAGGVGSSLYASYQGYQLFNEPRVASPRGSESNPDESRSLLKGPAPASSLTSSVGTAQDVAPAKINPLVKPSVKDIDFQGEDGVEAAVNRSLYDFLTYLKDIRPAAISINDQLPAAQSLVENCTENVRVACKFLDWAKVNPESRSRPQALTDHMDLILPLIQEIDSLVSWSDPNSKIHGALKQNLDELYQGYKGYKKFLFDSLWGAAGQQLSGKWRAEAWRCYVDIVQHEVAMLGKCTHIAIAKSQSGRQGYSDDELRPVQEELNKVAQCAYDNSYEYRFQHWRAMDLNFLERFGYVKKVG